MWCLSIEHWWWGHNWKRLAWYWKPKWKQKTNVCHAIFLMEWDVFTLVLCYASHSLSMLSHKLIFSTHWFWNGNFNWGILDWLMIWILSSLFMCKLVFLKCLNSWIGFLFSACRTYFLRILIWVLLWSYTGEDSLLIFIDCGLLTVDFSWFFSHLKPISKN